MKIHKNKIWESVLMYSGAVLILILVLWNIKDLKIIHVLNDEYGYWASAAFFAASSASFFLISASICAILASCALISSSYAFACADFSPICALTV